MPVWVKDFTTSLVENEDDPDDVKALKVSFFFCRVHEH
jgi:hypothetical protein